MMKITLNELEHLVKNGYTPKIHTPTGQEKILDTYRKSGPGRKISFSDNTSIICADNHLMFHGDDWIDAKDFIVGSTISNKQITEIKCTDIQEWIDFSVDAPHESYYHNDILHHNSGKSLIIYLIFRQLLEYQELRGLIIVPTVNLVSQLFSDFEDYSSENGFIVEDNVHKIYQGQPKETNKNLTISTWQSIFKQEKEYFDQFDYVICDEVHLAQANSIRDIMEKLDNTKYRIGLTGTLSGMKTHKLVLEGLFGTVKKVISTKELIDKKELVDFNIKCLVLKHSDEVCKLMKSCTYQEEIEYIISNELRNKFIKNLAVSMNNNTLVLFQLVDKHGKVLYNLIKNSKQIGDRKVFFVHGGTATDDRENIRRIVEEESNAIIVASFGVYSTGVNIRNLHNIIFASPSKSRVRNLQSIGRGLRQSDGKTKATLYDIADDLRHNKHVNFGLKHFMERTKIYTEEKFKFKLYKININGKESKND